METGGENHIKRRLSSINKNSNMNEPSTLKQKYSKIKSDSLVDNQSSDIKKRFIYFIVILTISVYVILYLSEDIVSFSYLRYGHPKHEQWNPNDLLKKSKYIVYNKVKGPEAIVFSSDGSLYTGLSNGNIVRIDNESHVEKIIEIGQEKDERICDFVRKDLIAEPPCGRPFGIRLVENEPGGPYLYVSDSFFGLIKINLQNNTKKIIFHANDTRLGDKPLKSTEDLDVDGDLIYFVDSTFKYDINEALKWHEGNSDLDFPSGRLFRYDQKKDKLELLLENLYYPNGVLLIKSKTEQALLINEFSMGRIIKYYLSGPNKGKKELFAELPGFSESIRLTEHNTVLVPFVAVIPREPSLFGYLSKFAPFRAILGYLYTPQKLISMMPKYGLIAEFDLNKNIIKTWHDTNGEKVNQITSAVLHNNKIYMGSFDKNYIAIVDYK